MRRWTYTNESLRSGMAVLDVTIPTGYMIQQQKLDAYVRRQEVRNLQRARFLNQKVVFYFDYVSFFGAKKNDDSDRDGDLFTFFFFKFQLDDSETCVRFTVERWLPVANMSRYLPVRVYDYYAPGTCVCTVKRLRKLSGTFTQM